MDEQQTELLNLIHKGNAPARVQTRARILLLASQGQADQQIAQSLLISVPTVERTRRRFVQQPFHEALYDRPRSGRPPLLTGEIEARLVALTCTTPPVGYATWTLRLLAGRVVELGYIEHLSHTAVADLLKKTNSSPGE